MLFEMIFTYFNFPEVPAEGTAEYKELVAHAFFFTLGLLFYIAFAPRCINPFFFELEEKEKKNPNEK